MATNAEELNELVVESKESTQPAPVSTGDMLFGNGMMDQIERIGTLMASAKNTIPNHLKGSVGDCIAIVMQSAQWGMNPYSVAQKTHLVKGTLGYEAQLVNAVITSMAPTTGRLKFEWFGPWENIIGKFKTLRGDNGSYQAPDWSSNDEKGLGVKVWATLKGEDEPRELVLLLSQAQVRNSTLWASDPKQQLAYLGIKRWSRLYTPDVIMGVYTPDELQETSRPEVDITPAADDLNKKLIEEKIKTLTVNINNVKSVADLGTIGKIISNEPKEVQEAVRKPYDVRIKALKAAEKKSESAAKKSDEAAEQATQDAIADGAPTYPEVMDLFNSAKKADDIESALSMIGHFPQKLQDELTIAGGNALEKLDS